LELAFQQVRGHDALFALVGVVPLPASDLADQPQGTHQLQHGLFGDCPSLFEELDVDPAVPVPAVVLGENLCNSGLQGGPRIGALEAGLVVEERGPG
jgi:hypothetical protein